MPDFAHVYTYDANGNLLTDTTGTGTTTYTYNNANLITGVTNTLQSHTYGYQLDGNISLYQRNDGNGNYMGAYTYDSIGRLTNEHDSYTNKKYTYDKYGNITAVKDNNTGITTTRTYDKNNRLMTETAGTSLIKYYYDPNGNTTAKNTMSIASTGGEKVSIGAFAVTNTDVTLYGYNGLNQLISVNENGLTSSYTYDGTGLRQTKTVNGTTTTHIWDGTNMVAEANGEYILKRYYRGANGLIFANLAGIETKYLKDGHGNITGLANMSGTTLSKSYTYDAFGVEKDIDTTDKNPFRYCGEYYDNEIDKIYLRARYYSPIQGRFITEDPIKDGLNWYSYCAGDPVNYWDPSGLVDCPTNGVKGYNELITDIQNLIITKIQYENEKSKGKTQEELQKYSDEAQKYRNFIINNSVLNNSPELRDLCANVIYDDGKVSSVEEISAVLNVVSTLQSNIVNGASVYPGVEIMPEEKVDELYENSKKENTLYVTDKGDAQFSALEIERMYLINGYSNNCNEFLDSKVFGYDCNGEACTVVFTDRGYTKEPFEQENIPDRRR